ncbi:MAG: hypothetical protein Q7R45_14410 [Sulfuricaulis sp.]|nr:hypothetical protein [Sulfuricaulis sp.]
MDYQLTAKQETAARKIARSHDRIGTPRAGNDFCPQAYLAAQDIMRAMSALRRGDIAAAFTFARLSADFQRQADKPAAE